MIKDFVDHYADVIAEHRLGEHAIEWDDGWTGPFMDFWVEDKIIIVCFLNDDKKTWKAGAHKQLGGVTMPYWDSEKYQTYWLLKEIKETEQEAMNCCQQWYLKWLATERIEEGV